MASRRRSRRGGSGSPDNTVEERHRGCSSDGAVGDVLALLSRHHQDLDRLLLGLLATEPGTPDWWTGLDDASFGFSAHIDAESKALSAVYKRMRSVELERLLAFTRAEHAQQQYLLHRLTTVAGRDRAIADLLELRSALLSHDDQERMLLLPAIRESLPIAEYDRLAESYTSERLFALGTMPLEVIRG